MNQQVMSNPYKRINLFIERLNAFKIYNDIKCSKCEKEYYHYIGNVYCCDHIFCNNCVSSTEMRSM